MQAKDICLLASRTAKGGTGMVALAGQFLNLVLEDLKLNRDLKINRVTQSVNVGAGSNGPFILPTDYLRTYDMFYPLQGPNGTTQFLTPITMEQYDAEFKPTQTANYPYEFATDLSTQARTATSSGAVNGLASLVVATTGYGYYTRPVVAITGGVVGATATVDLQVLSITPAAFGAAYTGGDELTLLGGTFVRPFKIKILAGFTALSPGGFIVLDYGDYTVLPGALAVVGGIQMTGPVGFSGGTGAGATAYLLWGIVNPIITAAGVGTAPVATVSGGSGQLQGTLTATAGVVTPAVLGKGQFYVYPQSNGALVVTHRYMRDQPDLVAPETSTEVPWFPFTLYLERQTAALLMGVTGDSRELDYLKENETMLRPHLIMEGDEQQAVHAVRLDPRHFKTNRGLRPTKTNPY